MKEFVTGISGQDGYFLLRLLLSKGNEVHCILRRNSSMTQGTVDLLPENVRKQIVIHYGDITDGHLRQLFLKVKSQTSFTILQHRVSLATASKRPVHIRCKYRWDAERLQCHKGFIARYRDVLCRHFGTVRAA